MRQGAEIQSTFVKRRDVLTMCQIWVGITALLRFRFVSATPGLTQRRSFFTLRSGDILLRNVILCAYAKWAARRIYSPYRTHAGRVGEFLSGWRFGIITCRPECIIKLSKSRNRKKSRATSDSASARGVGEIS